MKPELCKSCIHTKVCMRDKNLLGDVYVPPNPWFFSEEYRQKAWENYEKRKAEGFPCDDYLPTIDPVKHGRWILDRLVTTNGGTYGVRRCSLCEAYYEDVGYGFHYCPNCGAIMVKGEEDETD